MIVVAERDAEIRDTVRALMSARGYRVELAADADTAARLLSSGAVDVLVAELALRRADGTDLLSLAGTSSPTTRRIAIASDASARDRDAGLRLGAIRVLAKPLSLLELADAIGLAHDCADGFHGSMHRMSLIDVLQMYHQAGQSLAIAVHGEVDGVLALRNGELIHAECNGRVGMPALVELVAARRGQIATSRLEQVARTLTGTFDQVLLEALRSFDEAQRTASPAASADLAEVDWLDEHEERAALDHDALTRWLVEHAPGAGAWRIDVDGRAATAPRLERIDSPGLHPERELAGPPGALGWAYELAELGDPQWTRVELTTGGVAVSLIRTSGIVIGLARLVSGDATLRRFQLESARLARWLSDHIGGAR